MDVVVHDNPITTALSNCQLFKSVEWQTIQQLSESARLTHLDRGQTVFHSGNSELSLFLVNSGQVKVSILASNGSERVIDVISSGETLGELGMFSSMVSRLNAVMLSKGEIIEIPRNSMMDCLKKCSSLASSMLTHLDTRLCRFVGELENCCLRSARQRVIDYLLMLVNKQSTAGERLCIQLPANKGVTASLLDITPETFSRELNRLISMGLILVDRKTIRILDLPGMEQAIG
ncbi:MAG: Crp/Fnr family transcriptional regulator [Gammaproteobacteria bacterium]|nr:Crp/Fnr family transcriptional regulator [Gammaproteobacteria bacterium]